MVLPLTNTNKDKISQKNSHFTSADKAIPRSSPLPSDKIISRRECATENATPNNLSPTTKLFSASKMNTPKSMFQQHNVFRASHLKHTNMIEQF